MTTLFYQWGVATGGIDPHTGLPPPVIVSGGGTVGPPEQFSGTLGAGVTTISFSHPTVNVTIRNTDDINALEYSYDNVTWFRSLAYQVVQESVQISDLYLRAVAGAPTYEVLGTLSA
jgi:hypothetical protein